MNTNNQTKNLTVQFMPSQDGVHRVCWKNSTDLNYDCNDTHVKFNVKNINGEFTTDNGLPNLILTRIDRVL